MSVLRIFSSEEQHANNLSKSRTRAKLTDKVPFPSGKSAYRFLLKKADVLGKPQLADFVQKKGEMKMWFDVSRYFKS